MTESYRQRVRREAASMDAGLRALFAQGSADLDILRRELERLAQEPQFSGFTWYWGPRIGRRPEVVFRSFILGNFSIFSVNSKAAWFNPWKGETASALDAWLEAADAAGDSDMLRRLLGWKWSYLPWKDAAKTWNAELRRRLALATQAEARLRVQSLFSFAGYSLEPETAKSLFLCDTSLFRTFILHHLPRFGFLGARRADWEPFFALCRTADPDFSQQIYRWTVSEAEWRSDVLALAKSERAESLDRALEQRHPQRLPTTAALVFAELAQARGEEALPYILRHAGAIGPRWGFLGRKEAKGFDRLLAFAESRGSSQGPRGHAWDALWGLLMRSGATPALFDKILLTYLKLKRPEEEIRARLCLMAGHGRSAHFAGLSLIQVQPLTEATALWLYKRFPDLLRGAFLPHVAAGPKEAYPKLCRAAIEAKDEPLIDVLASRIALGCISTWFSRGWAEAVDLLTQHYESLPEDDFVRRASAALSRAPAYAVGHFGALLDSNRLARLFFLRSTALYLSKPEAVRDLLESPQIHVQALGFRILGRDDPRAPRVAAAQADLLEAALLRPLHRKTRLMAFEALHQAIRSDEATARRLLQKFRDALALPERGYPREALLRLIGTTLARWPALQEDAERPMAFVSAMG